MNWGPYVLCAAAVAGLLWAEYRGSRTGLWLAKPVASLAFIWAAHAGFDRALCYGLKYATGFGHTHLGRIGGR